MPRRRITNAVLNPDHVVKMDIDEDVVFVRLAVPIEGENCSSTILTCTGDEAAAIKLWIANKQRNRADGVTVTVTMADLVF
jgi:hypothetical protein